jgi:5-hmdU DNA kinase, helical domain
MVAKGVDRFFAYARERYNIHLKRAAGVPAPWTTDRVLREWRFCNVFREDDKTTAWFREQVRNPLRWDRKVIMATIAFRWFNRVDVGERLLPVFLADGWDERAARRLLRGWITPLVTGAYIVKTPPGMKKLDGICACLARAGELSLLGCVSLEEAHRRVLAVPYLGNFMAYEVVTDLRHTAYLEFAPDINTWANPGPGAARGLGHVFGAARGPRKEQIQHMCLLLEASRDEKYWLRNWPAWELREVEHTLCEYDKYVRARNGERLKRRYR